jgi:hypothetical protein
MTPAIGEGLPGSETVSGAAAMLISDDGRFIAGTEIHIDGDAHRTVRTTDLSGLTYLGWST